MDDGEFISARKLAGELDTSFTPVREALLRLSNEGYLSRVPSVGFFKAHVDYGNLHHYYESRMMVECFVLPKVIKRMNNEQLQYLRALAAQQGQCLTEDKIVEYGELDIDFHCYLIDLHGNRQISQFYRNLREQNRTYSKQHYFSGTAVRVHNTFLDCIEAGNYDEAIDVILEPLISYIDRVKRGSVRL